MVEFEQLASSEGAKLIYQRVVGEINLQNHPSFLKRPIKVLDLAGGNGTIGVVLKHQCEASFGPLSSAEFGDLVDYVNIDRDLTALSKSPGRAIHGNVVNVYRGFSEEEPFDFILSVNPNPAIQTYSLEDLKRRHVPDSIGNLLLKSSEQIKSGLARITLISAALLLQEDGKYVFSGFMDKDTFNGTLAYLRESDLGLKLEKDHIIELDEQTRDLFVTVDTGERPGSKSFGKLKAMYSSYKLLVMRMNGAGDKQRLTGLLDKEVENYRRWTSFLEGQDRFGSW
jgi:hypothetical protein